MTDFQNAYEQARSVITSRARLAATAATGLLDSEVEETFDRLTRLAVRLLRVPAAFISLVDENRDFYKSVCGFGEPLASTRQLEGPTFCHFTITGNAPLVIPDTRIDPVYSAVPTVRSMGVAAYVGVPIVIDEQTIGAFCVVDTERHDWSEDEITIISELADVALSEISLRRIRSELQSARRAAEEANLAKSQFLAAMSHDLRTPLSAIGGHAQLLQMGVHGPLTEPQQESLARIIRAQQHLLALVGDILQFARLEKGAVALEIGTVSLADLCPTLDFMVRDQAVARGLTFSCDLTHNGEPLVAHADGERVLQIVVNLTSNAIKFTESGGCVTVTGAYRGDWVELSVTDTGQGIDPDEIEKIFEPFVQVGERQPTREGVGLGLTSSRYLARLMGGDVSVQSTPGTGSTFTLTLKRGGTDA